MNHKEVQQQIRRVIAGSIGAWLGAAFGIIGTFALVKVVAQHHMTRDHPDANAFLIVGAILFVMLTTSVGIWLGIRTTES